MILVTEAIKIYLSISVSELLYMVRRTVCHVYAVVL